MSNKDYPVSKCTPLQRWTFLVGYSDFTRIIPEPYET
jgi:hypothetical protein